MNDLAEQLVKFISAELLGPGEEIDGSTDLLLSGMVDSLGVIQIVVHLETELDMLIDPADVILENFQTVDAMVAFVERTLVA